jgi:acetyl esterase/lipase
MKKKLLKIFLWTVGVILVLAVAVYIAFQVSPWPSVLLIRNSFQGEDSSVNDALAKYTPTGIVSKLDIQYDTSSDDAMLDLYYPEQAVNTNVNYPLLIWVHGGGFIAGDKKELSNYCKILASKGFVVAAVNYSVAPEFNYPVPVSQLNSAIAFLVENADRYHIDASEIFIAGDSGGAHITAVLANIYTNTEYSSMLGIKPSVEPEKLKGIILYCGPYNTALVNLEGDFGWFLKTVLWAYIGRKDFINDPKYVHFSVSNFITENFPPTFISVGNQDPLRFHSHELASRLSSKDVSVDSLFFPDDYSPGLPHEYQFNLDTDAGKLSLERSLMFLAGLQNKKQ